MNARSSVLITLSSACPETNIDGTKTNLSYLSSCNLLMVLISLSVSKLYLP